jgi:hypothetical protein
MRFRTFEKRDVRGGGQLRYMRPRKLPNRPTVALLFHGLLDNVLHLKRSFPVMRKDKQRTFIVSDKRSLCGFLLSASAARPLTN